jgi:hypothetical protein
MSSDNDSEKTESTELASAQAGQKLEEKPLDRRLKQAQIFAFIASPILVAAIAAFIQYSTAKNNLEIQRLIAQNTLAKEFVQLAIPVLLTPRQEKPPDEGLRSWAGKVMAQFSPVTISADEASQLSGSLMGWVKNHPMILRAMEPSPACPPLSIKDLPIQHQQAAQLLLSTCQHNQQNLFWLQFYTVQMNPYAVKKTEALPR